MAEAKVIYGTIGYSDVFGSFLCVDCAEDPEWDTDDYKPILYTELREDADYVCGYCGESLI